MWSCGATCCTKVFKSVQQLVPYQQEKTISVKRRNRCYRLSRNRTEPHFKYGRHGFKVVAYNRTTSKVDEFLQGAAKGTNIIGAYSLEDLDAKLEKTRKVMLMVRAGDAHHHGS